MTILDHLMETGEIGLLSVSQKRRLAVASVNQNAVSKPTRI